MKKFLLIILVAAIIIGSTYLQIKAMDGGYDSPRHMVASVIREKRDSRREPVPKIQVVNRQYDFSNSQYLEVEAGHQDFKNISRIEATYDYVYYEEDKGTVKIHIKAYDANNKEINSMFRKENFETSIPDMVQKIVSVEYTYGEDDSIHSKKTTTLTYRDGRREMLEN